VEECVSEGRELACAFPRRLKSSGEASSSSSAADRGRGRRAEVMR